MPGVVIEGVDGAGKTTIAREMEKRGYAVHHCGVPKTNRPGLELLNLLTSLAPEEPVVFDRFHLGNRVYGPLDRSQPGIPEGEWRAIEACLIDRGISLLWLDTDPAECYHRCQAERTDTTGDHTQPPDHEWPLERFIQLHARFKDAAAQSFLPRVRVVNNTVVQPYLPPASDEQLDPEGWGSTEPVTWVLGEQQSKSSPMPGPFLTRCGFELVWPVVNPRQHRVSNALPPWGDLEAARRGKPAADDLRHLQARWELLGKPEVVALGSTAHELCLQAGVATLTELPHPQHHLRFQASRPQAYQRALMDVLDA